MFGVVASPDSSKRAAQPGADGLAIDVPLSEIVLPLIWGATTLTPGAKMSVVLDTLVKLAGVSASVLAPTEITLLKHAGALMKFVDALFPADANATTPFAT